MDPFVVIAAFAPLVLLIWVLVRYGSRIQHDVVDSDWRTELLESLNPALVRFVLERDRHICQSCGGTTNVGVDFAGETPEEASEINANDIEARCADCYLAQWRTLGETGSTGRNQEKSGQE